MAQVILRTVDNAQIDPARNRLMYKAGDVIAIVEDAHQWGEAESKLVWIANGNDPELWPGGFFILRIPDATVAELQYLLEESGDWIPPVGDPATLDPELYLPGYYINNANRKRRKHWTDFVYLYASLNNPTRKRLDAEGEYTVTLGMINNYFKVKT